MLHDLEFVSKKKQRMIISSHPLLHYASYSIFEPRGDKSLEKSLGMQLQLSVCHHW